MLHWQNLSEVAQQIKSGSLTSTELTTAMLERSQHLNPKLNCYQVISDELALQQAEKADELISAGNYLGPLHGIPVAVKDLCDTAGIATAAGMEVHRDRVPSADATVVRKLQDAGAVMLGKLTMTEGAFATHHPSIAAPLNPWGDDYWSGVSSSGSGVATAAGLCFGSLGTDTLGSIRFPSTANGVTGLKPTWGRVSRSGVFPLAPTMDHVGPIARTAEDCALLLSVLAGADPLDATTSDRHVDDYQQQLSSGVSGVRIGIDRELIEKNADETMTKATLHVADVLSASGATLVDIKLPPLDQVARDGLTQALAEVVVSHQATYPLHRERYGPAMAAQIDAGLQTTGPELVEVGYRREAFTFAIHALFNDVDLFLLPAMNVSAPTIDQIQRQSGTGADRLARLRFTAPLNMSRSPALTLPAGTTDAGVPVGVQIVGAHFDEAAVLAAGHAFQQQTKWHQLHPPTAK